MFDSTLKIELESIASKKDCQLVAMSTLSLALIDAIFYNDVQNRPDVLLASSIFVCLRSLKDRGVRKVVRFGITDDDEKQLQQEVFDFCTLQSIACENDIDASRFVKNGDGESRESYLVNACAYISRCGIVSDCEYPILKGTQKNGVRYVPKTGEVVCESNRGEYNVFSIIDRKYQNLAVCKVDLYSRKGSAESILIPQAPMTISASLDSVFTLFKGSPVENIWGRILLMYYQSNQPIGFVNRHLDSLVIIANYIHSFLFFRGLIRELVDGYNVKLLDVYALCGDKEICSQLMTELNRISDTGLVPSYSLRFRKVEQGAFLSFEHKGGINPGLPLAEQIRIGDILLKSKNVDDALTACFAYVDSTVSYSNAALLRALQSTMSIPLSLVDLVKGANEWINLQIQKGTITRRIVIEDGYFLCKYVKGMVEFDCPQRIARIVLNIYRTMVHSLNRNDIQDDMLRSAVACALMEVDDDWLRSLGLRVDNENRTVMCRIGDVEEDVVSLLIRYSIFVAQDNLVAVTEFWRGREDWANMGLSTHMTELITDRVRRCLMPFRRIPIQLFRVVFNAYFIADKDSNFISGVANDKSLELQNVIMQINMQDHIDVRKQLIEDGCRSVWEGIQDYLVEWQMALSQAESMDDDNGSQYLIAQRKIHRIDLALKIVLLVFYYNDYRGAYKMYLEIIPNVHWDNVKILQDRELENALRLLSEDVGDNLSRNAQVLLVKLVEYLQ